MEKGRIQELLTRQVKEPVRFYENIAGDTGLWGNQLYWEVVLEVYLRLCQKKIDKTAQLANVEDQSKLG